MLDVGLLLQALGTGISMSLVVEVVGRDENGCVTSVRRVPVRRVSTVDEGEQCARIIIDEEELETVSVYPNHEMMRLEQKLRT